MDFEKSVLKIKNKFSKTELKIFDEIQGFNNLLLASTGSNDKEGYQIFTPDFIVRDMCTAIGDDIIDFDKTILEPTSGDGAFTVYILNKRLESIKKESDFEIAALKALSTIYSVEMDKELMIKQRNNILTVIKLFVTKNVTNVSEGFFDLCKCIITKNFIWGMFNSDREIDHKLFGTEVVYKMPEAEKKNFAKIYLAVWKIGDNDVDYVEEDVELC